MSKSKQKCVANSIQILNYLYYSQSESKINSANSKISNRNNDFSLINTNTNNRKCLNDFNAHSTSKSNLVQVAGHAGRFKASEREGFILKCMDKLERLCLEELQNDILAPYVPYIDRILFDGENQTYTEMQDCLYGFHDPCIMDIKIGVRTFLESDLNEKEKPR